MKDHTKSLQNALITDINQDPHVTHNLKVIGDLELEPEFEFFNRSQFHNRMQQLIDAHSNIIKRISLTEIVKEYKKNTNTLFLKLKKKPKTKTNLSTA